MCYQTVAKAWPLRPSPPPNSTCARVTSRWPADQEQGVAWKPSVGHVGLGGLDPILCYYFKLR